MIRIIKSNSADELKKYVSEEELSLVRTNRHVCHRSENNFLISFMFCNIENVAQKSDKVFIHFGQDLIFITGNDDVISVLEGIEQSEDEKLFLIDFFEDIIEKDIYRLENYENKITALEDHMLTQKRLDTKRLNTIMLMRHEILKIKRYYEQLAMITNALCESRYDIFDKEQLTDLESVDHRLDKLLEYTMNLREYITQVREAYQAQIDIEQNNIMRIFTVITTIFFPLTLIVGWYGMNVKMPEYAWEYGYPFVIVLSILVCIICIVLFKVKKWF